jgi:hypothetical protein
MAAAAGVAWPSEDSEPTADAQSVTAAADELYRVRDLQDSTVAMRRFLGQLDEDTRAAALNAAAAGIPERAIAARLGLSQPSVHAWMDERRSGPLPAPALGAEVWSLHTIAAALASLVGRLEGRQLPERAPSSSHVSPRSCIRAALDAVDLAAKNLRKAAAAADFAAAQTGDE